MGWYIHDPLNNIPKRTARENQALSKKTIPLRVYLGIPFAIVALYLGIRLSIEQTLWTWERGLQMVGFSLAHGAGILLYPLLLLGLLWAGIHIIISLYERSFGGWLGVSVLSAFLLGVGLMSIPYDFWQSLFIEKIRRSPYAYQQFKYSLDKPQRIKYLLDKGFAVNLKNEEGKTPLHLASEAGLLDIAKLLINHDADLNAIDDNGDSPLYLATIKHHETVAALLSKHGAKNIKGSAAQRLDSEKKKFIKMIHFSNGAMGDDAPPEEVLKQMEKELWEQHLKEKKKVDFQD